MWSRLLSSKCCVAGIVLLGMLLMAPAVNIGFVADDYIHWAILTGQSPNAQPGSAWGLFTFFDGNEAHNQALKDSGRMMWWGSDLLKLSFWRPLSEVFHWLDYRLWPHSLVMMHVQNVLWYGLLVWALSRLYALLDADQKQARLATWLFAGNYLHVFAVAWIASRNQMIAGILLVASLSAFHLWRSGRGAKYGWLAGLALLVGLLSAEAAIATAGYMAAYMVTLDRERSWFKRGLALLPFAIVVLAWKAVHSHLGYGSLASPAYIDPASNLPRFVQSMVLRLPALMGAQWFGASTGVFEQLPHATKVAYASGAIALLAGLGALFQSLRLFASPLARFYVLGSVLVLVPACATLTMDRLVLNANIGMSGFLAIVIQQVLARREQLKAGVQAFAKYVVYVLAGLHVALFPAATLFSAALMKTMLWPTTVEEPISLPPADKIGAPNVILVNPPAAELIFYYPLARAFYGVSNPQSMQVLGPGNVDMVLSRPDASTLKLTVPSGITASMARDEVWQPAKVGEKTHMGQVQVEVLEVTPDHRPKAALFRFPRPLPDAQWVFYAWKGTGYVPFSLPDVGQRIELPAIDLAKLVSDRLKTK